MKITLIIPSYRRPQDLERCLGAIQQQFRPVDELIVVMRDTDAQTWEFIKHYDAGLLPLRMVTVVEPGVIAAMNLGLANANGDIVVFTDDDAVAHPDWLAKLEQHYQADMKIGGVGGRDCVYLNGKLLDIQHSVVGQVKWFGKVIGNHHAGSGAAREVDVLKGVNMSFRQAAIDGELFDPSMKGSGAQIHFEIEFCLRVKKSGWKILYDPSLQVDHYPSQRFDEDQREGFHPLATANLAHNETVALLKHLSPIRRIVFMLWACIVGHRGSFGLIQLLRFLPRDGLIAWQKYCSSMRGRWQGLSSWSHSR
ncbi:glycosyltransferase [filamentous cyanobacterium LEGE 11480]|uniref:Glycosyltransferase n=1 Tax=Romeriopsis navalis LEGE 11480 TaxID=2777977 RepID=A0A928Z1N7_9CYAN|nr:glycosyltransferase [Romeriopsis navalis]MBE9029536.1 glycosyltransferase [Romeriopsis navalis LEGE 11480]